MKIAIVDLGTNTFNLMIVETDNQKNYKVILKRKISVKLGQGGISKSIIGKSAFERGVLAMTKLNSEIRKLGVEKITAFATSAIRSSSNGGEFVKKVQEETGIEITVISGLREAELIYLGVRQSMNIGVEKRLILDIGGGSTEFIIGNGKEIFWKQSFDLGIARLLDRIKPSNPIKSNEIEQLNSYLADKLNSLFEACREHRVSSLIGSSGSFDSLSEMNAHLLSLNPPKKSKNTSTLLKPEHFEVLYQLIISSTKQERLKMKGLVKMRIEMIVLAVIVIRFVMDTLKLEEIHLSTFSMKEGILFELLHTS